MRKREQERRIIREGKVRIKTVPKTLMEEKVWSSGKTPKEIFSDQGCDMKGWEQTHIDEDFVWFVNERGQRRGIVKSLLGEKEKQNV